MNGLGWMRPRLSLVATGLVVGFLVALGVGHTGGESSLAQETGGEFSLQVEGCSGSSCEVPVGSDFTVGVSLDSIDLPDIDGDTAGGYAGFQLRVMNSARLTQVDTPENGEVVWPDCGFPAENRGEVVPFEEYVQDTVLIGCTMEFGENGSTFTGLLVELVYSCASEGTGEITLPHGITVNTFLVDEQTAEHAGDSDGESESVEIMCVPAPAAATATTTTTVGLPPTGNGTGGGADMSPGLLVLIAALAMAGFAGLGAARWAYARRR